MSPPLKLAKLAAAVPLFACLPRPARPVAARWLRREVELAGCIPVKIAQWVSSRDDIFPAELTSEFGGLRNAVAPMDIDELLTIIESSEIHFDAFDETPIAQGSIAQVHRATFRGSPVAVKVRRLGILENLRADVGVLRWLLRLALERVNKKMHDDLAASLDDLVTTVTRELDFPGEAAHMTRFRAFFETRAVVVPRVLACSSELIVMEYVASTPYTGTATVLMASFLAQFFELGWLHTDMHAGNVGQTADGQLVLYDFGSVLECPPDIQSCIKQLMVAYMNKNTGIMVDYMLEYGLLVGDPAPDERAMLEAFVGTVLEYVEVTDISRFAEVMKTIAAPSTPSTVFRPEIFMIFRSFTLLEGLCKSLDPDFVILDAVAPLTTAFASDPSVYRMKIEDDLRVFMKNLF